MKIIIFFALPSCFLWISVGVTPPVSRTQTQPVVVTQPAPVPISVTYLADSPGLVRCPNCHHTVTSEVTYLPGRAAWCMCVLLSLMGWDTNTHMHEYLTLTANLSFNKTFMLSVFQVDLWFLSDPVHDEFTTRCTSFLPTVWKPSAHIQKMTLSGLIWFLSPPRLMTRRAYLSLYGYKLFPVM